MTDYLERLVLNYVYRGQTPVFAALYTSAPDDTGAGTEVDDANYIRQQVSFSEPDTNGNIKNDVTLTFPAFAATSELQVSHVALFDAETGGNMLEYTPITPAVDITEGIGCVIQVGELSITLS
jgi:hypothetical protein